MSNLDQLTKLAELKEKGALTEEEFQSEKAKILNSEKIEAKPLNKDAAKKPSMFDKLQPCKTCKKDVSIEAKRCPHCGEKNPTMTAKKYAIGCFVFIVIVVVISMCSHGKKTDESPKAEAAETTQNQNTSTIKFDINVTDIEFTKQFNSRMKQGGLSKYKINNLNFSTPDQDHLSRATVDYAGGAYSIEVVKNSRNNKIVEVSSILIADDTDEIGMYKAYALFTSVVLDSLSNHISTEQALKFLTNLIVKTADNPNLSESGVIDKIKVTSEGYKKGNSAVFKTTMSDKDNY